MERRANESDRSSKDNSSSPEKIPVDIVSKFNRLAFEKPESEKRRSNDSQSSIKEDQKIKGKTRDNISNVKRHSFEGAESRKRISNDSQSILKPVLCSTDKSPSENVSNVKLPSFEELISRKRISNDSQSSLKADLSSPEKIPRGNVSRAKRLSFDKVEGGCLETSSTSIYHQSNSEQSSSNETSTIRRVFVYKKPPEIFLEDIILKDTLAIGWLPLFKTEFNKPYFKKLSVFLYKEMSGSVEIYPSIENMFTFAKCCPFNDIKVVIVNQNPYNRTQVSNGLCFSVFRGVHRPISLLYIFKELSETVEGFTIPKHGCLLSWAKQGVLLLNLCLTVRTNEYSSHTGQGWEKFTNHIIMAINQMLSNVVFMLWGRPGNDISNLLCSKHYLLKAPHPSPFSAYTGFLGCNHFNKANDYLRAYGKTPINWNSVNDETLQ